MTTDGAHIRQPGVALSGAQAHATRHQQQIHYQIRPASVPHLENGVRETVKTIIHKHGYSKITENPTGKKYRVESYFANLDFNPVSNTDDWREAVIQHDEYMNEREEESCLL